MGRVLASTVAVTHPDDGRTVLLERGTELPDWAEGLVADARLDSPLTRYADLGATDEEVAAMQRVWDQLTDDQRATARDDDLTDDEVREQLTELRQVSMELGVSVSDAIDRLVAEGGLDDMIANREKGTTTTVPLAELKKDDLLALAEKRNVDLSDAKNNDERVAALRAAGIEG